ncbi:prephenate/arogenate dehydrogenase family protein [Commensalibacter papalotli (ex Botero et al. 2024)]|uniref:Prephenate dehydrogenase (TyrA) (PDB:2F1K) n=1 Tax=Commensalibacter papalotli (ex Botero et al. 2024) TaxID=2972766 RepID=A0ABM9HR30_9PROT|nr:prephenate/arogenate dehydrogenase family protein [Commensalibacter papalotli (ex Botero et al. 2024)]CAI3944419.1 Prephenate dehydrogenase (TyrA) (PDB:2F1K) [Commensalibacter papalotli (ex Botero et al. 2024)]CAI3946487.1 Prephenate dehydrogenase (TyrA) (PDB:2F1K) [Commensalibacter papalotli (ex Botero et al. 2024)]
MTSSIFHRVTVIGPGLIGSSILRRIQKDRSLATYTVAYDNNPDVCNRVKELQIADEVCSDPETAVKDADCVILAVPVGVMGEVTKQIAPYLQKGAILTDTGSTKASVIAAIEPHLPPDVVFVPTHPMAGTEFSGPDAGFESLFENRWCLITPTPNTTQEAIDKITEFWQKMGSNIRILDIKHHDKVCAIVSHLPHLIAFTICNTADSLEEETRSEVLDYAASGFRDFTRVASSDPTMWRDVFINNREAILEMLARFTEDAQAMAKAIRWKDEEYITETIQKGRRIRKSLIDNKQVQ